MPKGNRQEDRDTEVGLESGQGRQELGHRPEGGLLEGENEHVGTDKVSRGEGGSEGGNNIGDEEIGLGRTHPLRSIDGLRDTKRPDYKRQVSIFDPSDFRNVAITIAGLGNIGSHTALALTRMGLSNFTLFDFDTVEEHNLASQAYSIADVGQEKILALVRQMMVLNPDVRLKANSMPFTGKEQEGQILISAVDSMAARRTMCEGLPGGTFVFDGRMGGGQIELHSQLQKDWGATLEMDGDEDPCGARFISYTSYIIAGLIANNVKRYLMKQKFAKRILFHVDTLDLIKVV